MSLEDLLPFLRGGFPLLSEANCRLASPADEKYNCIAWAAGDSARWWWPDPQNQSYWPPEVPRVAALSAFEVAFALRGFTEPSDTRLESGVEKVAIYGLGGAPTHAARQLPDGWWASKLGRNVDVEHAVEALDGPAYGTMVQVLARRAPS